MLAFVRLTKRKNNRFSVSFRLFPIEERQRRNWADCFQVVLNLRPESCNPKIIGRQKYARWRHNKLVWDHYMQEMFESLTPTFPSLSTLPSPELDVRGVTQELF